MRSIIALLGTWVLVTMPLAAETPAPSLPAALATSDSNASWWSQARIGLFIDWNLNPQPATPFNPAKFKAKQWVRTARTAGMHYLVTTAKDSHGFCLFAAPHSPLDRVAATLRKRQPLRELAAACKKQNLPFGVLFSRENSPSLDPAAGPNPNRQPKHDLAPDQFRELLAQTGPIHLLWLDDNTVPQNPELAARPAGNPNWHTEMSSAARSLCPGIIVKNAPDWTWTPSSNGTWPRNSETAAPAMSEMGIRFHAVGSGGRLRPETPSATNLVRGLCAAAQRGANFVVGVQPTPAGEMPRAAAECLARMGSWLKTNGLAIYGTGPSPFRTLTFDGCVTTKANRLYVLVFQWPATGIELTGIETPVRGVRVLGSTERISATVGYTIRVHQPAVRQSPPSPRSVRIMKPRATDPIATVVELELSGPPSISPTPLPAQSIAPAKSWAAPDQNPR